MSQFLITRVDTVVYSETISREEMIKLIRDNIEGSDNERNEEGAPVKTLDEMNDDELADYANDMLRLAGPGVSYAGADLADAVTDLVTEDGSKLGDIEDARYEIELLS